MLQSTSHVNCENTSFLELSINAGASAIKQFWQCRICNSNRPAWNVVIAYDIALARP